MIFRLANDLHEQMFQMTFLLIKENIGAKLFPNPCINVEMLKLWPRQAQFMSISSFYLQVWPWPSTYLNKCFKWHFYSLHEQMFQMAFLLLKENNCAK